MSATGGVPWPVEDIPEDERAMLYDTEQPIARRHEIAMRYVWALRATEANQRQEIAALRAQLAPVEDDYPAAVFRDLWRVLGELRAATGAEGRGGSRQGGGV